MLSKTTENEDKISLLTYDLVSCIQEGKNAVGRGKESEMNSKREYVIVRNRFKKENKVRNVWRE